MFINIDSNKYKDMTLASLHMGLIADRFKKRESIQDLTIEEIIESVGNKGQAFCRALLNGGTDEASWPTVKPSRIATTAGWTPKKLEISRCGQIPPGTKVE